MPIQPLLMPKGLLASLETNLKKLNLLRPISTSMLLKLKERFEVEMTYNSNAIEGNSLTLKETYWVVQEGLTVKGKPLKDALEAKNHKEALDFLYEIVEQDSHVTFSERTIRELHSLIIQDIDRDKAGRYRTIEVFISGTEHKPPLPTEVPMKMNELVLWAHDNEGKMNVIEFATILHHKFVHIHPFEDGNGRTGRLLMNIFLLRHGFPIGIIQKTDRHRYYQALRLADAGKYAMLVRLVAQAVLRSLHSYLDVLTPSSEKEPSLRLVELAIKTPYSAAYLGKLAKEGRIDAYKRGRNWYSTFSALENYIKAKSK